MPQCSLCRFNRVRNRIRTLSISPDGSDRVKSAYGFSGFLCRQHRGAFGKIGNGRPPAAGNIGKPSCRDQLRAFFVDQRGSAGSALCTRSKSSSKRRYVRQIFHDLDLCLNCTLINAVQEFLHILQVFL